MKISNGKLVSMTYSIYEGDNLLEDVNTPVSFIYGKETNLLPIVEKALSGKEKIEYKEKTRRRKETDSRNIVS